MSHLVGTYAKSEHDRARVESRMPDCVKALRSLPGPAEIRKLGEDPQTVQDVYRWNNTFSHFTDGFTHASAYPIITWYIQQGNPEQLRAVSETFPRLMVCPHIFKLTYEAEDDIFQKNAFANIAQVLLRHVQNQEYVDAENQQRAEKRGITGKQRAPHTLTAEEFLEKVDDAYKSNAHDLQELRHRVQLEEARIREKEGQNLAIAGFRNLLGAEHVGKLKPGGREQAISGH